MSQELESILPRNIFFERLNHLISRVDDSNLYTLLHVGVNTASKVVQIIEGMDQAKKLVDFVKTQLYSALAPGEIMGELSNGEFGLLLNDGLAAATDRANSMVKTIDLSIFHGRQDYFPKVMVGVFPTVPNNPALTMFGAELAFEQAKKTGDSKITPMKLDNPLLGKYIEYTRMLRTIRLGLKENRFQLHAQPIKSLNDAETGDHFEVLVRLRHLHATLSPIHFTPAAEYLRLMPEIDRYVIRNFSLAYQRIYGKGKGTIAKASINLSGGSVRDTDLASYIRKQFRNYEVPYEKVCFEMTETVANEDYEGAIALMKCLKELGCTLSLDDIGVGSSNLVNLRLFPVDYFKIDGQFVENMLADPYCSAVVDFINDTAHRLHKKTIAEWVSSELLLGAVRARGIDYAQGYHIGRPRLLFDPTSG